MSKPSLYIALLTLVLFTAPFSIRAQRSIDNLFVSNNYKGDEMFVNLYYKEAIKYYRLALKKNESSETIKLKIARSYNLINDYESSVAWYQQVLNDSISAGKPIDQYHYAEALLSNGQADEAAVWFKKFYMSAPTDSRSYRKFESVGTVNNLYSDSSLMSISQIPINTEFDEMAAIKYQQGYIFLSSRKSNDWVDNDFMRDEDPLNLYYVKYSPVSGWQEVKSFDKAINSPYHEGPVAFYSNQDKLILTRSNTVDNKAVRSKDGTTRLQLYEVSKKDGAWSKAKPLPFNNLEYSYAHPSLSAGNDTLYFASDMAGGYGGADIYMSVWQEDKWGDPQNLGFMINTEGDEMYPYIIEDRLFFSSNGLVGLGGLDNYKAYMSTGKTQLVVNLGYPINSPQDDFAYYLDKNTLTGTLSSTRLGGMGEADIYLFNYEAQELFGKVTDELGEAVIFGALVKLLQDGVVIDSIYTNEEGLFSFYLPLTADFQLEVSKDGHFASLPVKVASREAVVDMDTVKISLHKQDLFAEGRILNNETQQLMRDVRVVIYNTTDSEIDTIFTDANGTYSFVLVPDKKYSIYAGKSGFLVRGVDINTLKISRGAILNDIVLELEYSKKSVINFDYNKYNLKPEAIAILKRTVKAMKNSQNQLVISAYADARGTIEYNQELSDKRAKAVMDYFLAKGVAKSRITARGFGETLLLNRCIDGVDCEEVEHSKNRRAEIKIEGSTVK
jgi:outer membrane protein OmpA-like peptidoglycan-associated protein/tetratricopeptide (TPR) repeat protein